MGNMRPIHLIITLFSIIFFLYSDCNTTGPEDTDEPSNSPYVRVHLTAGGYEDFHYDGFQFNGSTWLRMKDSSGTTYQIQKNDMERVIFYGKTWSEVQNSTRWEYKIYYSGTSVRGHDISSSIPNNAVVSGNDFSTNAHKSVQYRNTNEVVFYR